MISLIICSRTPDISVELKKNIAATIGCEHELCVIDNSNNKYNIFQAYNEGVRRSKGDILCFMHDDILYHSDNWGGVVYDCFRRFSSLGCLGVAGSFLMLDTPSSFWHSGAFCMHYYGRDESGNLEPVSVSEEKYDNVFIEVASVDGMWMCFRRSLFESIRFDDMNFDGFHCYDSDICMQVIQAGYGIGVVNGVLVEHSKRGSQDANYFKNIRIWHNKWTSNLPLERGEAFSEKDIAVRTSMVKQIVNLEEQVSTIGKVYQSKAYKLGRALLKPFSWFRKQ